MARLFRFHRRSYFYTLVFALCHQALANGRQEPDSLDQGWYEKGWKRTTESTIDEDSHVGSKRTSAKEDVYGSGAGSISDLDEVASGIGEDDEDSDIDVGSGAVDNAAIDIGSGDLGFPVTPSIFPLQTTLSQSQTITSSPSSSLAKHGASQATKLYAVHTLPDRSSLVTQSPNRKVPKTTVSTAAVSGKTYTAHSTSAPTASVPKKGKPPVLDDRNKWIPSSFWMRPGVLAGLIGGAVAGLLAAILLVMFVVYRMRKKDEGSYAVEDHKPPPNYAYSYQKAPTREFFA